MAVFMEFYEFVVFGAVFWTVLWISKYIWLLFLLVCYRILRGDPTQLGRKVGFSFYISLLTSQLNVFPLRYIERAKYEI